MTRHAALAELLRQLKWRGYRFTSVTPATHARLLARAQPAEPSLRDIFGWSRSFQPEHLDPDLLSLLHEAEAIVERADGLRSAFRVSTLGDDLFLHSAFPTEGADAVFFGPDTYRFACFIERSIPALGRSSTILDMGAGSGAGGITAARLVGDAEVTLVDLNPAALELAAINAEVADVPVELIQADAVPRSADLIIANPPYMIDASARSYRDGGGLFGGEVALRWVEQGLDRLCPGGSILLYTGAAVVGGALPLTDELAVACQRARAKIGWEEIDPDVFGEELDEPGYASVERIAALGFVITKP